MTLQKNRGCQTGFTLLELLVVLSLLAVIMMGLLQAMRGIGQAETRIDQRLSRMDQMRVTRAFLLSVLSQVDASLTPASTSTQAAGVRFLQTANSIQWVGVLPARPGLGGRHQMQLSSENTADGKIALVLKYVPYQASSWPDMGSALQQVIVSPITSLEIRSQGLPLEMSQIRSDWPQGWQDQWPVTHELPQRISISISDTQGPWPVIVIPVHPTQVSQPTQGGFVTGGGVR